MESREERAAVRRATWTGFVARSREEAERYNRAVDESIEPAKRVEMIWELVLACRGEQMHQNIDLIELLRALNAAGAKFVIVGAYAFAIHGRPRATKDVDIFRRFGSRKRAKGLERSRCVQRPAR